MEGFINYVSNFHPALQFTYTISELKLPFLDITLGISNNRIQTSVYYKDTDTNNYLHHTSLHPDHCKLAILYSQFLRLRQICYDDNDFTARATEIKDYYRTRGYPETSFDNDMSSRVSTVSCDEAITPPPCLSGATDNRVPFVLTYNPINTGTRRGMLDN